jgi:hypothetical protein
MVIRLIPFYKPHGPKMISSMAPVAKVLHPINKLLKMFLSTYPTFNDMEVEAYNPLSLQFDMVTI